MTTDPFRFHILFHIFSIFFHVFSYLLPYIFEVQDDRQEDVGQSDASASLQGSGRRYLAEGGEEGPDAMAFNSRFAILSHGVVLAPVSGSPATNVGHEDSGWVFFRHPGRTLHGSATTISPVRRLVS